MSRYEALKKKRKKKKIILSVLTTILVLLGGATAYGSYITYQFKDLLNKSQNTIEARDGGSPLRKGKNVHPSDDPISILFIGVDQRPGKDVPSRSDAMVLATFNPKKQSIKMVSIPRDSKVDIYNAKGEIATQYSPDKITHSHVFGDVNGDKGIGWTVSTVEHLFDVPVDYYVQVNFNAFLEIINALDGVKVKVENRLVTQDSHDNAKAIVIEPGVQKLNGEEALAFVRNRDTASGDLGRGKRQMKLIKAIIDKAKSFSSITRYDNVLNSLEGDLVTNMAFSEILSLYQYADSIDKIKTMQLEGTNQWLDRYYYVPNEESVNHITHELKVHLGLIEEKSGSKNSSTTSDSAETSTSTETTSP